MDRQKQKAVLLGIHYGASPAKLQELLYPVEDPELPYLTPEQKEKILEAYSLAIPKSTNSIIQIIGTAGEMEIPTDLKDVFNDPTNYKL